MPKPVGSDQRYIPGLDGLRAIAVLAVIAFHEQFSWAPGGLLGVALFFTLSGYLITDLLVSRWLATGRSQLRNFWARRARRLLPALFVMLAIVTASVTLLDRVRLADLRGAVAAAASYASNWYLIVQGQSYFSRFAPPQPLDHLWSLAVEEQFYLIWPWLLLAGLFFIRRRRSASAIRWLALPTLGLAAGSATLMWVMYHPAVDPTRVYEGTDTRACGLLIGAALAMVWSSGTAGRAGEGLRNPGRHRRGTGFRAAFRTTSRVLDVPAALGLAVIAVMISRVGQYSTFLYHGGLVVLAVATSAVIAAAACPGSLVGAALSWSPLRWIGVRSYGIYLWHYPVIVLTTPANSPEDLPRAVWQIAASIALAALSWKFVEEPVRHGAIGRAWHRIRTRELAGLGVPRLAAATGATGVVTVACAGLAGVVAVPATSSAAALGAGSGSLSDSVRSVSHLSGHAVHGAAGKGDKGDKPGLAASKAGGANQPLRTSCTSVAHIGDSTSEGMVSADYLPQQNLRLAARYQGVGVRSVYTDITGARSVVEVLPGTTNGAQAVTGLIKQGFHGCWVIALGTNDTADVASGSNSGLAARISEMMRVTRGEPIMWVTVISLLSSGPYSEADMQKWNTALMQACPRYPNMRVFNWAALPQRSWFINDDIHYTSAGYEKRALFIADGLAEAFPLDGARSHCLVSLPSSVIAAASKPSPSPSPTSQSPSSPSPSNTSASSPPPARPAAKVLP